MKPRIPTRLSHKQTSSAATTTLVLVGAIAMGRGPNAGRAGRATRD